jgi:hypothetical protein
MKITIEDIRSAYTHTHIHSNGIDMDAVFEKGSQSNGYYCDIYSLVYYLIESMSGYPINSPFRVICIHSDGGIMDYMIFHKWNDYNILISREVYLQSNNMNFKSVQEFCDWLNTHHEKITSNTK